jgi:hypothetical protein
MKISLPLAAASLLLALSYGCQKSSDPNPPAPKVNAGISQTIVLPMDSVRLSGTATAPNKITAYLWSEVSGPNVPMIADEGLPMTMVHGLVAGSYIFQLMAIDSTGETGVDTIGITVVTGQTTSNTITDTLHTSYGGTTPFELMFLANSTYAVSGSSAVPEMLVEDWTIGGIEVWGRTYMKFDVSKVPAGRTIKSATLYLFSDPVPQNGDLQHANSGTNNDFYVQRISSNWNLAGGTDWNHQPTADTAGQAYVPQTSQPFLNVSVDITKIANSWLSLGNNGFVMRLKTEVMYNTRIFCSSTYPDANKHPYLVITY